MSRSKEFSARGGGYPIEGARLIEVDTTLKNLRFSDLNAYLDAADIKPEELKEATLRLVSDVGGTDLITKRIDYLKTRNTATEFFADLEENAK